MHDGIGAKAPLDEKIDHRCWKQKGCWQKEPKIKINWDGPGEERGDRKTTKTMAENSKGHQEALIKKPSKMEVVTYITGPPAAFKKYCREGGGRGNITQGINKNFEIMCEFLKKKSFLPKAHLRMQKIFFWGRVRKKVKI